MDDALTGAAEFIRKWGKGSGDPDSDLDLRGEERNLSLAGTALLWAGITDDLNLLEQELLVIRPKDSHQDMELVINEMQ